MTLLPAASDSSITPYARSAGVKLINYPKIRGSCYEEYQFNQVKLFLSYDPCSFYSIPSNLAIPSIPKAIGYHKNSKETLFGGAAVCPVLFSQIKTNICFLVLMPLCPGLQKILKRQPFRKCPPLHRRVFGCRTSNSPSPPP